MDIKTFNELGGALHKIDELNKKSIIETSDAAEKRANEAFVSSTLRANALELLGAWITVEQKYKPLVRGFNALFQFGAMSMSQPAPAASVNNTVKETRPGEVIVPAADPVADPAPEAKA